MPKWEVKYEFNLVKVSKDGGVRIKAGKGASFVETELSEDEMKIDPLLDDFIIGEIQESGKIPKTYQVSEITNINITPYEEKESRNFRKRVSKS